MSFLAADDAGRVDWLTPMIFIMVLSMGVALAWFVNRATTQIREALAEEALQQQHDVANLLHEYANVMLAIEVERDADSSSKSQVSSALTAAQAQLELMRFQYSFERLDGAATAHAYAKPVLEDVAQWVNQGIPGQSIDYDTIMSLSAQRLGERHQRLRLIANETNEVAGLLIADQSDNLNRFRRYLISLLGFYALLVLGFVALLIRQRNLQTQLRMDQEKHADRLADFAEVGADWFWEVSDNLTLKRISNQKLSIINTLGAKGKSDEMSQSFSGNGRVTEQHWPVQQMRDQQPFADYESEWITPLGQRHVISMSGKPLYEQGEFVGFRGIGRDITEKKRIETELDNLNRELITSQRQGRRQAEEALRDSEQFLSTSLDAMAPNIVILDKNATIKAANKAWRELTHAAVEDGGVGLHYVLALKARPASEQAALADIETYVDQILAGSQDSFHLEFPCEVDGDACWMEVNLTTFVSNAQRFAVLVYEDITERRMLEDRDRRLRSELAHVARLNTAGEMASVLAHEINQPLTAISHNCDSLLSATHAQPDEVVRETLQDIYDQSQRAGNIIHSLRQMMRKDTPRTTSVDINQLVEETVRLTTPEARENLVSVSLELAPDLPRVMIDPTQIQQVLVNLERNGVDAIRHRGSELRSLIISTALSDEGFIDVSVMDSGSGITPEIEKSLFRSFQTSKADGMGMGLSISRSIVEAHGGRLWLDKPTKGMTTFKFSLPVNEGENNGYR
jgi:two-component system sensor kinase FixL